jgi:tRNA uridine 5-carboxymethylaminomethyl modification enzyme
MSKESISPLEADPVLVSQETTVLKEKTKLSNLLLRPQISIQNLMASKKSLKDYVSENNLENETLEAAEILVKYNGYISKEKEMAEKLSKLEDIPLKPDFDYKSLKSLSTEAREKLTKLKPRTIGQASRISGISPSDINVLAVFIGR